MESSVRNVKNEQALKPFDLQLVALYIYIYTHAYIYKEMCPLNYTLWYLIYHKANKAIKSTRVTCVVKFGLDITRIPLRTDGRWKAYL